MSFFLGSVVFGQMYQSEMGDSPNNSPDNNNSTSSYTVSLLANGSTTYYINTAGSGACGHPGIDDTYDCASDGGPAMDLGTFTDINQTGSQLSSMDLVIYGACSGDVEFFLNGVSIASGNVTGPICGCISIASDPFNPQNYTVTITPTIQAAFIVGGLNTLSVVVTNSEFGIQCFYGADVTLATGPSVPLSNWALGIGLLLISGFIVVRYRRRLA